MRRTHKQSTFRWIAYICLLCPIFSAFALDLENDKKEKIYIKADSTLYNYKSGVNVFEGHVKVDQGSSHITADRLITKSTTNHQIKEAIAYGVQGFAHYWTKGNTGQPDIHARAKIIKFYPMESNVSLEQAVTVKQGENSFQGQLIFYNKANQTITVPASKNGRAVLVYNPDN